MAVAVVRALRSPRQLRSADDLEAFEQELVDQCALASSAAGISDHQVSSRYLSTLDRPDLTRLDTAGGEGVPRP